MELLSLAPSSKCRTYSIPTMGNVKEGGGIGQKQREEVKLMKSLVPPLMAALVALSPVSNPPVSLGQAIDIQRGATLFGRSCIGCHDGGGNIIQPGATLFLKDLQRNEVDTEEEIFRVTYYGKGRMPGFGENCTPRGQCTFGARLQEEEIKLLAEFVKSQAEQAIRCSVHPEDLTVIMMPLDKLYGISLDYHAVLYSQISKIISIF